VPKFNTNKVLKNPKNTTKITIKSYSSGSWVDGLFLRDNESEDSARIIRASVQPATEKEIAMLAEGERGRETIIILSIKEIKTTSESEATEADILKNYHGADYKIVKVLNWADYGHYRAIATRLRVVPGVN